MARPRLHKSSYKAVQSSQSPKSSIDKEPYQYLVTKNNTIMRTSTRCTRAVDRWRTRMTSIIGLPVLILLFSAFGNNLQAQNVDFSQGSNKNNTLGEIVWI